MSDVRWGTRKPSEVSLTDGRWQPGGSMWCEGGGGSCGICLSFLVNKDDVLGLRWLRALVAED